MNDKIKLMIATPAYEGKVIIPYAISLAETVAFLHNNNVNIQYNINPSGSLLVAERNIILQKFWESDCTHVLMIDNDLGWPAQAVLAMLHSNKDFIAGCYPVRGNENEFLFRAPKDSKGNLIVDKHLIKMDYVPAGFVMLNRNAIKKMRNFHKNLYYEPKVKNINNPEPSYMFFNTEIWNKEFWGEDFVFCRKAKEAGLEIWVDPLIQFNHNGTVSMLAEKIGKRVNL